MNDTAGGPSIDNYKVIIIGGGPGGYTAAIRAAMKGARVAVVEVDKLGGVCLNRGCIPSKCLIASAVQYKRMKEAESFGIRLATPPAYDWAAMNTRKDKVVGMLVGGIGQLFKSHGVKQFSGHGRITGPNRQTAIELANQAAEAENMAYIIDRDRQIVNFCYWRLLAEVEQADETLEARKSIYEGDAAFAEADLIAARTAYNNGLAAWRKVLDKDEFSGLSENPAFGVKLIAVIQRYQKILSRLDEQMPDPFILQDIIDLHWEDQ